MMSEKLPAVLQAKPPKRKYSSISMERALRQIRELLEVYPHVDGGELEGRIQSSMDDVDMMLAAIDR